MTELDNERRLTAVEERAKSNTRRLDEVERRQDSLDKLTTSVEVLATRQQVVENDVKEIKQDVKEINGKAGKKWENFLWECGKLLLAAIIGAVLVWLGLK